MPVNELPKAPTGLRQARPDEPAQAHYGLTVKPIPKPLNTVLRVVDPSQIIRPMRPTVGREVSLWMFRMAYYHGLLQSVEKDHTPWGIMAGRKFGRFMELSSYEHLDKAMRALKLGVVEVSASDTQVIVDVDDCAICAGMIGLEEPPCSFIGGLVGSVVEKVTGKSSVIRQTRCQGMGHPMCRFEIEFGRNVVASAVL